jgi:hypothetical protein
MSSVVVETAEDLLQRTQAAVKRGDHREGRGWRHALAVQRLERLLADNARCDARPDRTRRCGALRGEAPRAQLRASRVEFAG